MAAKTTTAKTTADSLIAQYMAFVLENGTEPVSVYKFCKDLKIKEEEFYAHFGSFQSLQAGIWNAFYEKTEGLLLKNKAYRQYNPKEKLLTFFYTFFEMLTLNRSYVLLALEQDRHPLKYREQLGGLRKRIRDFGKGLVQERNQDTQSKFSSLSPTVIAEGVWVQFLFLLKFWKEDSSTGFERTDVAIEKSVNTIFEVFDYAPLDSIIDFGKFLYGDKMSR